MDKEQAVEELRQVIAEYSCNKQCTELCEKRGYCSIKRFVTNIIDAGYGNIKQAIQEFADEFHQRCKIELKNLVWEYGEGAGDVLRIFEEIENKYLGV